MPIGTIIGIESRDYVAKGTGEVKRDKVIYYTYEINRKNIVGLGASSVYVDTTKFEPPSELGSVYMIDKDAKGYLTDLAKIVLPPADKKSG